MEEILITGNQNLDGNNITKLGNGVGPLIPDVYTAIRNLLDNAATAQGSPFLYVLGDRADSNIAQTVSAGGFLASNTFNNLRTDSGGYYTNNPRSNNFGAGFENNVFNLLTTGGYVQKNTFGANNSGNNFTGTFNENVTGFTFQGNTFATGAVSNVFGNANTFFAFGTGFANNRVGNRVSFLKAGTNVRSCEVQDDCTYVTLGDNCLRVTVINCVGTSTNPILIPAGSTDVTYRNGVLDSDPFGVAGKLNKTQNLSDLQSVAQALFNLGLTESNQPGALIKQSLLGSNVEEVVEYDTVALMQAQAGVKSVLYVITTGAENTRIYRWSGSQYVWMNQPGAATTYAPVIQDFAAVLTVTVVHNFNRLVGVTVWINGAAKKIAQSAITYMDANTVRVDFNKAYTGTVVVS